MSAVRTSTRVGVDPVAAFRVFTEEIDAWWQRGPRFRFDPERDGTLRFEGGAGGCLVEEFAGGDRFVVGEILAWEPPTRLVFEFRAAKFEPGETTEVEVRFEPDTGGTRVEVEHRGWEGIRPQHPARHGLTGPAFRHLMGVWWADLLQTLRAQAPE